MAIKMGERERESNGLPVCLQLLPFQLVLLSVADKCTWQHFVQLMLKHDIDCIERGWSLPLPRRLCFHQRLSVCMSVCQQDHYKTTVQIFMKYCGIVGHSPGTNRLDFPWPLPKVKVTKSCRSKSFLWITPLKIVIEWPKELKYILNGLPLWRFAL